MVGRITTALITCAASQSSAESIVALKHAERYDVRVIGVDVNPSGVGRAFADHYDVVPPGDDPTYPKALLDLCRREEVAVVIPTSDEEALALARHQSEFRDAGVVCAVPAPDVVDLFADKGLMYQHLAGRGVQLPAWRRAEDVDELREAAIALGYPGNAVVAKPARARGGRGVWRLRPGGPTPAELFGRTTISATDLDTFSAAVQESMPSLLVMEDLAGEIYDVDMLLVEQRLHVVVPRRRFNQRGIPFQGCALERHDELERLAREVHENVELRYLIDIDAVVSPDGAAQLLEVNPRPSGGMISTVAAGVNLLELLLAVALGDEVPEVDVPYGLEVRPSIRTSTFPAG